METENQLENSNTSKIAKITKSINNIKKEQQRLQSFTEERVFMFQRCARGLAHCEGDAVTWRAVSESSG